MGARAASSGRATARALRRSSSMTSPPPPATGPTRPADDVGRTGEELWRSGGATAGAILVIDIIPAAARSSFPSVLTNVNGTLFFAALDGCTGDELWACGP